MMTIKKFIIPAVVIIVLAIAALVVLKIYGMAHLWVIANRLYRMIAG